MKRWLKWVLITLALVAVLIVFLYALVTRPFFVRTVLLPRISAALDADITATQSEFAPFSRLVLYGVKFDRQEPRVTGEAHKVTVVYKLSSFITGAGEVDLVQVEALTVSYIDTEDEGALQARLYDADLLCQNIRSETTAEITFNGKINMVSGTDFVIQRGDIAAEAALKFGTDLEMTGVLLNASLTGLTGNAGGVDMNNRSLHMEAAATASNDTWNIAKGILEAQHDGTVELRAEVGGTFNPKQPTADLALNVTPVTPAVVNTVAAAVTDYNFGNTNAQFRGNFVLTEDREMNIEGNLEINELTVTAPDVDLGELPPTQVKAEYALHVAPGRKAMTIDSLNIVATQNQKQLIECILDSPVTLTMEQLSQDAQGAPDAEISFIINDLDLRLANSFLAKDSPTQIRSGTLSAELSTRIQKAGSNISITGLLRLQGLALLHGAHVIQSIAVVQDVAVTMTGLDRISIDGSETAVAVNGADSLKISHSGYYNLSEKAGRYRLAVQSVNETLFSAIPRELLDGMTVDALEASGHVNVVVVDAGTQANLKGEFTIPRLAIIDPAVGVSPTTSTSAAFDIERIGDTLHVNQANLSSQAGEQIVAHAELTGSVVLPPASEEGNLSLQSKGMDLKSMAGLGYRLKQISQNLAAPGKEEQETDEDEEPPLIDLEKLRLRVNFEIENWQYGQIPISKGKGTILIQGGSIKAAPVDLVVNGATVHLEGDIELDAIPPAFAVNTALEGLALTPFIAEFGSPRLAQQVKAELKMAKANISGTGSEKDQILNSLDGNVTLELDLLSLTDMLWLQDLVQKTGIPELQSLVFNKGSLQADLGPGAADLKEFSLAGKNLRLNAAGDVAYNGELDLRAALALGGDVLERLRKRGLALAADDDGYYAFPTTIPVQGPITRPTHGFTAREFLRGTLKDSGQRALQEALDSASKGEKIDPKSVLEGIFGIERKKPAETPPADEAPQETGETQEEDEQPKETPEEKSQDEKVLNDILNILIPPETPPEQ